MTVTAEGPPRGGHRAPSWGSEQRDFASVRAV